MYGMAARNFVMNLTALRNFITRHGSHPICAKCHKPLRLGQEIVSKTGYKLRYYHKECFESLYIEC